MIFKRSRKQRLKEIKIGGWGYSPETWSQLSFSQADAMSLESRIQGSVILPNDPSYHQDRQEANLVFQTFPQLIVYCEVFADVRECLAFARKFELWIACRSGGHSTAGYSVNTGMVIDLSKLNYVVVDPHQKRAIVGGGTNFGHLNATLDLYKLHLPGGGCQGVCVGGYMQGGGYGFTSRQFGMHCDNVLEMLVMLHDGRIVRTNDHCNKDLFWAIRGGTGGNFGIVLEIEYQLHDLWQVWGFGLKWPIANGAAALLEMQNAYSKDGASDKLGYMGMVAYQTRDGDPKPEPCVMMRGLYDGSEADGKAAIASLLALPGVELELDRVSSYFELDPWLLSTPTEIPECPDLAREDKQSGIIAKPLALADWQKVLDMFLKTPNPWTTIVIEPYGGAINRKSPTYNAFIHRDGYMDLFMDVFWMNEHERVQAVDYLDAFIAMMSSYYNGHEYQNYPRAKQKNYRWAYWGTSFNTLLAIKQKYDPHDLFRYQQSIKPYPAFYGGADDSDITVDTSSLLFPIDEPIQYEPYASAP